VTPSPIRRARLPFKTYHHYSHFYIAMLEWDDTAEEIAKAYSVDQTVSLQRPSSRQRPAV
jgi:hypothetical protein